MDRYMLEQSLGHKIPPKTIYLIRHGQSLHNASYFESLGADLNDPRYIDSSLTPLGRSQACELIPTLQSLDPQLLVCSPLTRAIQTLQIACEKINRPSIASPLCTERMAFSCDIGRLVPDLQKDFPKLDLSLIEKTDEGWWWMPEDLIDRTPTGTLHLLKKHPVGAYKDVESVESLQWRVNEFRKWLLQRPESTIAVFAHGVFLTKFIGDDTVRLRNCELRKVVI